MVSRFMYDPQELHWKTSKINLRYLRGIVGYGLVYKSTKYFIIIIYKNNNRGWQIKSIKVRLHRLEVDFEDKSDKVGE